MLNDLRNQSSESTLQTTMRQRATARRLSGGCWPSRRLLGDSMMLVRVRNRKAWRYTRGTDVQRGSTKPSPMRSWMLSMAWSAAVLSRLSRVYSSHAMCACSKPVASREACASPLVCSAVLASSTPSTYAPAFTARLAAARKRGHASSGRPDFLRWLASQALCMPLAGAAASTPPPPPPPPPRTNIPPQNLWGESTYSRPRATTAAENAACPAWRCADVMVSP
mmetsp:Transcript_18755/g.46693  ORF Transcript_18755/g.46693 Transcript_18755/m.46693 type:complete len:223 (-) Transcript_18755:1493-2161(-)